MSNSGVSRIIRRAMKADYLNAKILSHRANLQRYATLLATQNLNESTYISGSRRNARKLPVWNLRGQPKPRRRKKPLPSPILFRLTLHRRC